MYKHIIILFISLLFFITGCGNSTEEKYPSTLATKDKFITYFKDSKKIESVVDIKKGKYDGIYRSFYLNGKIKQEAHYANGVRQGIQTSYYENGKVKAVESFKLEKLEGSSTYYRENGKIEKVVSYKNGKQEGSLKSYHENGQLYQDFNYVNGKKEGKQTAYYPNGKIKYVSYFLNGQPGLGLEEFDEKGNRQKYGYSIIVQQDNKLRLTGECTYRFKLNKEAKDVTFYMGDLTDGRYLNSSSILLPQKNGWYVKTFYVPEGEVLIAPLTISSKITLPNTRQLVISKTINIALSN